MCIEYVWIFAYVFACLCLHSHMILIKLSTELVKVKLDFIWKTCRKFLCNQPGRVHRSASLTQYTFAQMFCFVLFCFISFLFCSSLLVFFLSLSLSDWAHPRVKVEAKPEAAHTMLIVALQLEHVLLNATHTPSRELCLVPRVVLVTSSYYPHAMYATICACERERRRVSVCVCVQLGQFKRRRRRRRPCKGLHAHLPDSFHCGDLLCEAPVAFCGCVSHKQTTANTHTHTHTSERYKE